MSEDTVGRPGEAHQLMAACPECGQVFGTGYALGPGASFSGAGNMTACPNCRSIVEIPDGEYGVVDGAVRWLREFHTPEQRQHLAEVLLEATQRLQYGDSPEAVAEQIERATGLRVWDFLMSARGAALGTWIAAVLALLTYLNQPEPAGPAAPAVTVNVVVDVPAAPGSVQGDAGEGDAGDGQDQDEDGLTPTMVGDVNDQHDGPTAGQQGQG